MGSSRLGVSQLLRAVQCLFVNLASVSATMSLSGTVKKFMEDKGFGFITPDEGGDDVFIHIKQCNGAESLNAGDKVSFDNEWDDRKGKYAGANCTVTSSGGGGDGGSYGGYDSGKGGKGEGKGKGKDKGWAPY